MAQTDRDACPLTPGHPRRDAMGVLRTVEALRTRAGAVPRLANDHRTPGQRRTARLISLAIAILVAGSLYLQFAALSTMTVWMQELASLLLVAAAFTLVGAAIASRLPENAFGWVLLTIGGLSAVGAAGLSLPGPWAIIWIGYWVWLVPICLLPVALILFPTGHLPSRRWVPALIVCAIGVLVPAFALGVGELDPRGSARALHRGADLRRAPHLGRRRPHRLAVRGRWVGAVARLARGPLPLGDRDRAPAAAVPGRPRLTLLIGRGRRPRRGRRPGAHRARDPVRRGWRSCGITCSTSSSSSAARWSTACSACPCSPSTPRCVARDELAMKIPSARRPP